MLVTLRRGQQESVNSSFHITTFLPIQRVPIDDFYSTNTKSYFLKENLETSLFILFFFTALWCALCNYRCTRSSWAVSVGVLRGKPSEPRPGLRLMAPWCLNANQVFLIWLSFNWFFKIFNSFLKGGKKQFFFLCADLSIFSHHHVLCYVSYKLPCVSGETEWDFISAPWSDC